MPANRVWVRLSIEIDEDYGEEDYAYEEEENQSYAAPLEKYDVSDPLEDLRLFG